MLTCLSWLALAGYYTELVRVPKKDKTWIEKLFCISNYDQVTWGVSCGVPDVDASDTCVELKTSTQNGWSCACNISGCNNPVERVAIVLRAEQGISGTGLMCHSCTGLSFPY